MTRSSNLAVSTGAQNIPAHPRSAASAVAVTQGRYQGVIGHIAQLRGIWITTAGETTSSGPGPAPSNPASHRRPRLAASPRSDADNPASGVPLGPGYERVPRSRPDAL